MNYQRFVGTAHVTATACAGIAAFGAAIGFHELAGSWTVALLIGAGTAAVLGLGWYGLIGAAASTRRAGNIVLTLAAGLLLTFIALSVSGWSLATSLGGAAALRTHQQAMVAQHEAALAEGFKRVAAQDHLIDAVATAGTIYGGYAEDETARGGCGPKCRTYESMGRSMSGVQADLTKTVEDAKARRAAAEAALAQARLGHDVEANLALAATTVAHFNTVDLDTGPVGLVKYNAGAEGVSDVATDEITQAIIDANASEYETVPVPVYETISKAEATLRYWKKVAGAWIAAVGIDCGPLLMLILVTALWREPLLRDVPTAQSRTDEDIRSREDSLDGKVVSLNQKPTTSA